LHFNGGIITDRIKLLVAELVIGAVLVIMLYGLYEGTVGSLVSVPEAAGVWLVLFLVLLVIIDIFLIAYALAGWERE
jgi:hypothetical protein